MSVSTICEVDHNPQPWEIWDWGNEVDWMLDHWNEGYCIEDLSLQFDKSEESIIEKLIELGLIQYSSNILQE